MTDAAAIDTDLLGRIPLGARRVLALGLGDRALGPAHARRDPRAELVEVDDPAALETMADRAFDAILLGALHDFADPATLLARLHRLLTDEGALVMRVAHGGHWTAVRALLEDGDVRPAITDAALRALLEQAGFARVKTWAQSDPPDATGDRWIAALTELGGEMGIDRAALEPRLRWTRSLIVSRKAAIQQELPLTLVINAMSPRFMEVRARLPAEQLQSAPDLAVSYYEKTAFLPALPVEQPKVAILQRTLPGEEAKWVGFVARAIQSGWLIVAELDDHPDLIAQVHRRANGTMTWLPIVASHAAQTSTPALAEAFRARQPEVAAFANAVFALPPWRERTREAPRIFYGALNRERFSRQVAAALAPVIATHPDAHFTVVHDQAFFEALPTAAKTFLPVLPYEAYLEAMADCHIALMPREGVPAELFKSDVKWLEASARGLATVASPAVYRDTIRDGASGLIAETAADFAPALARLLEDAPLRGRLARTAWEEVRDGRMFAYQVAARRDWYWSLWHRRAELEAALRARVPALDAALTESGRGA